jgi:hypothetical protein
MITVTRQTIARQILSERAVNRQMSARHRETNAEIRRKVYGNVRLTRDCCSMILAPTTAGQYGDSTGDSFPPYAWPGGYTIEYVTDDGAVLCAECARREVLENRGTVYGDIYYEGPIVHCDDCNAEIESAYGDPDSEDQD